MLRLYMIRHGQSTTNLAQCHAGWAQVPLTVRGEEEAKIAGKKLEGIRFDRVYSSDLLRAKQTQQIALPGVTAKETWLLRECGVGSLEGKTLKECYEQYGESYRQHRREFNYAPYGGESKEQLNGRLEEFCRMIEQQDGTVAAFCHGGVIRAMLDLVTGAEQDRSVFAMDNGSVSVFGYNNGKWRLITWNA